MYVNLIECLRKKGLSTNAAATLIHMPEATFRTKLQERSFSIEEAFIVKDNLFPEIELRYLFEKVSN